jgi:hypothetical protein
MESKHSNSENQNEQKPTHQFSARIGTILNSPLVVLLVGSLIGILGLFTWQRQDWEEKAQLSRAEVIFDRQVNIIEKINVDVGNYLADANTAIEAIRKGGREQQETHIKDYNQRQAEWFGVSLSHQALLLFYFPEDENRPIDEKISAKFQEIIEATKDIDIKLQLYFGNRTDKNYQAARDATNSAEEKLNEFNLLCKTKMKTEQIEDL